MMTPSAITPEHYPTILHNNARFVHWLAPLDEDGLVTLLGKADYARQLQEGQAVLIGYDGHSAYRHVHVDWLCDRFDNFFYIDRVIVSETLQGQGAGHRLYADLMDVLRSHGFPRVACEVNTIPDNPGSHAFHLAQGFSPLEDVRYNQDKAVRYYTRKL